MSEQIQNNDSNSNEIASFTQNSNKNKTLDRMNEIKCNYHRTAYADTAIHIYNNHFEK